MLLGHLVQVGSKVDYSNCLPGQKAKREVRHEFSESMELTLRKSKQLIEGFVCNHLFCCVFDFNDESIVHWTRNCGFTRCSATG